MKLAEFSNDGRKVRTPGREFIMNLADHAAFGELLLTAFPGIRFMDDKGRSPKGDVPREMLPQLPFRRSLAECTTAYLTIIFDPHWAPDWVHIEDKWGDFWSFKFPHPLAMIQRSGIFRMYGREFRPTPGDEPRDFPLRDRIFFNIDAGDEAQEAVANKTFRLLAKVATKKGLIRVRPATREIRDWAPTGVPFVGLDLMRRCRDWPDALIDGNLRPAPIDPLVQPDAKRRR